MCRTMILLAAAALVVSGCGGSGRGSASPTAAADHAGSTAQRALLTRALATFERAASGRYESEVTADGLTQPVAHESGSFQRASAAARYERAILGIDQASGKPRVQVVRVIRTADAAWYLQLKEWGSWTGCWLRTDTAEISRLTGVRIRSRNPLPTAVEVLAQAKVVGAGDGLDGPHLAVDAYTAVQFLGVASSATADFRTVLAGVPVPVLLDVTADGAPSGAAVEGTQVVAALKAAGAAISAELSAFISKTHARVVLSDLGGPVDVSTPPQAELLPARASTTSTCAVNR